MRLAVFVCVLASSLRAGGIPRHFHDREAQPAIRVWTDCSLKVNGFDQIERRVLGLTAYEGPDVVERQQDKRIFSEWGVACVGMAGAFEWVLPKGAPRMDASDVDAWFADPGDEKRAAWFMTQYPGPGTDRYVAGRIVPLLVSDHVEPFVYLLGLVPGSSDENGVPYDIDLWARFAGHYVSMLREIEPRLRLVHVTNEPNAFWFKSNRSGKDYALLLNATAKAIREVNPDVEVGGPVICWPPTWPPQQAGQRDWYTWESWSKPVIDGCKDHLSFFDWHSYDVPSEVLEGEIHVVTGYAQVTQGRWLRNAITEMNYALTRQEWNDRGAHYRKRVLPMAEEIMMAFRNPDKLFVQQVHDFNAWVADPGCFRWRPDEDGKPTPMMELFRILKPLAGTRLRVESPSESLRVEAAVRGRRLALAILNRTPEPWNGDLKMFGIEREWIVERDAWVLDAVSLRPLETDCTKQDLTLPPESLTMVTFELNRDLEPQSHLLREEIFCDSVMQPIPDHGRLMIEFQANGARPMHAGSAAIRLGLKGPSAGMLWDLEISGQEILLEAPGPFVEVRLKRVPRRWPVELCLTRHGAPEDQERANLLSFASLVLEQTVRE